MMALDINKIIQSPLNKGQYFEEKFEKKQIFLHHTGSSGNAENVISGWNNNIDKIGTAYVINGKAKDNKKYKDGDIIQCFDDSMWNYHLGIKSEVFKKYGIPYQPLDKNSIGIELASWGPVTKQSNGTFKNYVGGVVPNNEVTDLGKEFRGYQYYNSYTEDQINSLKELLIYLCDKYKISKKYNEGMFDVHSGCLNGANGIWTHCSCRSDKYDCPNQPLLVEMLKSLETK